MHAVAARTVGLPGRFLLSAGPRHMVVDRGAPAGGPGEAFGPRELLVGALATCTLTLVEGIAAERGIEFTGMATDVEVEQVPGAPRFAAIRIATRFTGISAARADELGAAFRAGCPIYAALSADVPVSMTVEVVAAL